MLQIIIAEVVTAVISVLITRAWVGSKPLKSNGDLNIGFHDGEVITWMSTDLSVNDLVKMDHIVLTIRDVRKDDIQTYRKIS